MPKFLIFFGVSSRFWVQAYVSSKKGSTHCLGIGPLYGKVKFVFNDFIKIMGENLKIVFFNPLNQNHYTC